MCKLPVPLVRCVSSRKRRRWPYVPPLICQLMAGSLVFGLLALFCFFVFGLR